MSEVTFPQKISSFQTTIYFPNNDQNLVLFARGRFLRTHELRSNPGPDPHTARHIEMVPRSKSFSSMECRTSDRRTQEWVCTQTGQPQGQIWVCLLNFENNQPTRRPSLTKRYTPPPSWGVHVYSRRRRNVQRSTHANGIWVKTH